MLMPVEYKAEKVTHIKGKTNGSSSDPLNLPSFSKWELFLKERICSQRERFLFFKSSSLWY